MKLKNIKNIQLIHIAIILAICTTIIFISYQHTSTEHTLYNAALNQEQTEILPKEDCSIEKISNTSYKITCIINKKYLEAVEYNNYVEGPGVGIKINLSILIKHEDKIYKIKTLKSKEKDENIYFVGYIKSENLLKENEILLLNNENGKIYKYTGGTNEEYM